EVRVNAMVSLNGRESEPLIDPNVDLAKVQRSLAHSTWILPLKGELRMPKPKDHGGHPHHQEAPAE
ncbi:MAG: HTTM domain-containing protein, partial [Roseimicrobium sp.]